MSYHNLNNEEIVFLYYVSYSVIKQYEDVFAGKSISQTLPTDLGSITIETGFPEDFVQEMMESRHYTLMKEIHEKLTPLYELIKEADPHMVQGLDDIFNFKPK